MVTTCGVLNWNTQNKLETKATEYLVHHQDLLAKSKIQLKARMEFVLRFEKGALPATLDAHSMFDFEGLKSLLQTEPMLLPFQDRDDEDRKGLHTVNEAIVDHLCLTLETANQVEKHKGGYQNAWRAYQAELAMEEFFYGGPQSKTARDREISKLLGTSSVHPDSKTHKRGALALDHYAGASITSQPPDLENWATRWDTQRRIKRLFPVGDYMEAQPQVLGGKMVEVLVNELFDLSGEGLELSRALHKLQDDAFPQDCTAVEYQSRKAFVKDLIEHKYHFRYPLVIENLITLVESYPHSSAAAVLEAGLRVLGIKRFPKVYFVTPENKLGLKKCHWDVGCLVVLLEENEYAPPSEKYRLEMRDKILDYLVVKLDVIPGVLDRYRQYGLPWFEAVETRIPGSVTETERLLIHIFCTGIGHLQAGFFIKYNGMNELVRLLPFTVGRMQGLTLLSHDKLTSRGKDIAFDRQKMYKLWRDIPVKARSTAPSKKGQSTLPTAAGPCFEPVRERMEEDDPVEEPVESMYRRLPASTSTRWKPAELDCIPKPVKDVSLEAAYQEYQTNCEVMNTFVRSKEAFRKKRKAVFKSPLF